MFVLFAVFKNIDATWGKIFAVTGYMLMVVLMYYDRNISSRDSTDPDGFHYTALEAAMRQCPVVAAYVTSIPEVLGSNAIYVDPYSVESIVYGIKKMLIPKTRECYKQKIEQSIPYIKERINESNKGLFEFIFT